MREGPLRRGDRGANVDSAGLHGLTPRHATGVEAEADTARLLLDRGADVDLRDSEAYTLHIASLNSHFDEARLCLEREISIGRSREAQPRGAASSGGAERRDPARLGPPLRLPFHGGLTGADIFSWRLDASSFGTAVPVGGFAFPDDHRTLLLGGGLSAEEAAAAARKAELARAGYPG